MMLRPVWIVAFYGRHASSGNCESPEELRSCTGRIRLALLEFQRIAANLGGDIELLTSASAGADQIAIEVAESLGIAVHIILPLPVPEFAEDFRGRPQAWDMTLASIAKAGGLIDRNEQGVSALCQIGERKPRTAEWPPAPIPGWTFRVSEGAHERDACYHDCGTQILGAADALIVVKNQGHEGGLGGVHDVVDQAKAHGIPIVFIPWMDQQPQRIEWNAKPWGADFMMTEMESACQKSNQRIDSSAPVESVFAALDETANRTGGRLRHRVTTMIALQFSATILAAINSALLLPKVPVDYQGIEFQWDAALIGYQVLFGCELVLVVTAFFLGLTSRWTKLKSRWRQTRFGAEILRGLIHTRGLTDPLYPVVSRHNPDWHRFALSSGLSTLRVRDGKAVDWETAKAKYHLNRMEHQRKAYYQEQLVRASRWSSVYGHVAFWASILAPICLILAMYLKFVNESWISTSAWSPVLIKFLPILLPLLAGTATSLKIVTDAGRRAERYRMQANRLQAISDWFPKLKTSSSIRRAVVLTEEILLDELIEWHAASKNTGK